MQRINYLLRLIATKLGAPGALDTGTWLATGETQYEDTPSAVIRQLLHIEEK